MPWEAGLKGTVLVQPGETVKIAVQFTARRGLFLVHCHNLEHEDVSMMFERDGGVRGWPGSIFPPGGGP